MRDLDYTDRDKLFNEYFKEYWKVTIEDLHADENIYKNQKAAFDFCWGYFAPLLNNLKRQEYDFVKLQKRYQECRDSNMDKRVVLLDAYEIIECLYNLDTLDPKYDKSWIDEAYRRASMFLQNNKGYRCDL